MQTLCQQPVSSHKALAVNLSDLAASGATGDGVRSIRKGAADSVRRWVEEGGGTVPVVVSSMGFSGSDASAARSTR